MAKLLSLRERIMQALKAVFEAQVQGAPSGLTNQGLVAEFDFRWHKVTRYPLGDAEAQALNAVSLIEGDETKTHQMGATRAFLPVEVNFRVYLEPEDEPATCLNNALLNIQRLVRLDPQLGGLCEDVREEANSHTIQSFEDRQVEGTVFLSIRYKHAENDPRLQRGIP